MPSLPKFAYSVHECNARQDCFACSALQPYGLGQAGKVVSNKTSHLLSALLQRVDLPRTDCSLREGQK